MSDPDISIDDVALNSTLPDGWESAKLAQCSSLGFGQSPPSETYNTDAEGLPFFQGKAEFGERYPTIEKWCTEPTRIAERGDILLSIRAPVGPTNIAPCSCGIGRGLASIRPHREIPTDYILYYLKHIAARLASKGTGTTFGAITKPVVQSIEVPIAPAAARSKIVQKLDELFSRFEEGERALERVQKLVERYRQSVLKAAVTGELTREWREKHKGKLESGEALLARILKARREAWEKSELGKMKAKGQKPANNNLKRKYKEPVPPDTSDLPDLPDGWVWASLGQLLSKIEAGKSFRCEERPPKTSEYGVVKVSAVTWGEYDEAESKTITESSRINRAYQIRPGDFLFSRANTLELVGACVIVKDVHSKLLLSDKILRFVFPIDIKQWIDTVLKSRLGRLQIESLSTGNQESMRNIGQERMNRIAIPLPSEAEIGQVSQEITKYQRIGAEGSKAASQSGFRSLALRSAVLGAAFSGQLVTQDESDEPASILLERIAAERNHSKKKTAPKRRKREMVTA